MSLGGSGVSIGGVGSLRVVVIFLDFGFGVEILFRTCFGL